MPRLIGMYGFEGPDVPNFRPRSDQIVRSVARHARVVTGCGNRISVLGLRRNGGGSSCGWEMGGASMPPACLRRRASVADTMSPAHPAALERTRSPTLPWDTPGISWYDRYAINLGVTQEILSFACPLSPRPTLAENMCCQGFTPQVGTTNRSANIRLSQTTDVSSPTWTVFRPRWTR